MLKKKLRVRFPTQLIASATTDIETMTKNQDAASNKLIYSPFPTKYYARTDGLRNAQPGNLILRSRNRAWWNLVWLMLPEIDDALTLLDQDSLNIYAKRHFSRSMDISRWARAFIRNGELDRDITLETALKTMQPIAFVEHLQELPYKTTKFFQRYGSELIRTMKDRAHLAEHCQISLVSKENRKTIMKADRTGWETLPIPSEIARCAWLQQAVHYLKPYIVEAGLTLPPVKIEMDGFHTTRSGCCYGSVGGFNRIAISPHYVDSPDVLATLAHELVHAIDNNIHAHYRQFIELANRLGFIGTKMPIQPGPKLMATLEEIRSALGPYPHFSVKIDDSKRF